jgi:hypothetical protein
MDIEALKQRLQEQAHLSPEQAERAAQVALAFVAEHVPQAAGLLDKAGGAEGLSQRLGGLFNR